MFEKIYLKTQWGLGSELNIVIIIVIIKIKYIKLTE